MRHDEFDDEFVGRGQIQSRNLTWQIAKCVVSSFLLLLLLPDFSDDLLLLLFASGTTENLYLMFDDERASYKRRKVTKGKQSNTYIVPLPPKPDSRISLQAPQNIIQQCLLHLPVSSFSPCQVPLSGHVKKMFVTQPTQKIEIISPSTHLLDKTSFTSLRSGYPHITLRLSAQNTQPAEHDDVIG